MSSPVYEGSLSFFGYGTLAEVMTGMGRVATKCAFGFQAPAAIDGVPFSPAATAFQGPGTHLGGVSNRLASVTAEDPGASECSTFRKAKEAGLTQ